MDEANIQQKIDDVRSQIAKIDEYRDIAETMRTEDLVVSCIQTHNPPILKYPN